MTGQELANAPIDGVRCRDAVVPEVASDGPPIKLGGESGQRAHGLQLGCEGKQCADPAVVERLLTEAVAHQMKVTIPPVPQGGGEHPLTRIESFIDSPPLHRCHQHLGIGSTAEPGTAAFQSMPDLDVVVDLAVVGHDPPAAGRDHGLGPARSKFDDGQTPVTESHTGVRVDPQATVVRSSMHQ